MTAAAVMFVFNWVMALTSLGVFVAVIALTRYVSLGTICATLFFVVISFLPVFGTTIYFKVFVALLASIIVIKHRENIRRLAAGAENKLSLKEVLSRLAAAAAQSPSVGWFWGPFVHNQFQG